MCINSLIRKMYISILTCILILLTAITTTYAWFGMNNYIDGSTFDLQINDTLGKEDLLISLDGVNFSHSLSSNEVMKHMLDYKEIEYTDENLRDVFQSNIGVDAITPTLVSGTITGFENLDGDESSSYVYTDLFIAVQTEDETNSVDTCVYIDRNIINGVEMTKNFTNFIDHPDFGLLSSAKINTKNFARMAIVKHDVVETGISFDVEGNIITENEILTDSEINANPITTIFTPSSDIPYFDEESGVYNFGGLDVNYNASVADYNKLNPYNKISIPDSVKFRGDTVLDDPASVDLGNECNLVVDTIDHLRNGYMMKIGIYFWMEGWDPDCFGEAANQLISYELSLTTVNPYGLE